MPRFEVRCSVRSPKERQRAIQVLASRYPEIEIVAERQGARTQVWVCVAPSATHVQRWTSAAGLHVRSIGPPAQPDGVETGYETETRSRGSGDAR
jgi:hypothetical protein